MRRAAVAIVVGALLAAGCSAGSSEDGRSAPNFVVIYTDDLDATVTPMRDALPQTMALLADEGLTFTNSFVSDPHCCPARASTLTGRYAHNTGVFDGTPPDGGWSVFAEEAENDTVATRLSDNGYSTGFLEST